MDYYATITIQAKLFMFSNKLQNYGRDCLELPSCYTTLIMVILIHVISALASLVAATFSYFYPTQAKLRATVSVTAIAIASGTYLIVTTSTQMLHSCLMGLAFVGIVGFILTAAQRKLAKQTNYDN